ncbi:MAG: hypothetical protein ACI9G1_002052 [Pirellulaceae bacterium]|jgi:hypothetical protein
MNVLGLVLEIAWIRETAEMACVIARCARCIENIERANAVESLFENIAPRDNPNFA